MILARRIDPQEPSRVHLEGRVLELLDQKQRPIWEFTLPAFPFPIPAPTEYEAARPVIADLDADGRKEVLYSFGTVRGNKPDTLYCFGPDGRVRWTRQIGRELKTAAGSVYPSTTRWSGLQHSRALLQQVA